MKVVKKEGYTERFVLTGMIVNSEVCGKIAQRWQPEGLFASEWANRVAKWCVSYYNSHGEAPNKAIEAMFRRWSETAEKETVKLVENFLGGLSGQYKAVKKDLKPAFVLDQANDLFTKVRINRLREDLETDLEVGKITDAEKKVQQYLKIELGKGASVSPLSSLPAMDKALDASKRTSLVNYPGALGEFFGSALGEECFVAFMAPEKRGKSFALLDLAWRGALQRNKVAFFEAGDLSEAQALRRFYTRAIGRPLNATRPDKPVVYPKKMVYIPKVSDTKEDNKVFEVEPDLRHYPKPVTRTELEKAMEKIRREKIKSKDDYFKMSVHPNSTLTVSQIRSILKDWYTYEGWTPKIIVVDYADILAPPAGFRGESRDAVNDNWKALRRLSQEQQCLVAVATQANAASYSTDTLGMQNFSEDKRKFSHVTGMIGLNQASEEKKQSVQRWNWLVLREEEFHVSDSVYVAQCLAIANPAVRSAI